MNTISIEHRKESERTRVSFDLDRGGCLTEYVTQTIDGSYQWLLPASSDRPSCFLMVPFCSRIDRGIFHFDGHHVQLALNNLPEPHAIHGHGFQSRWKLLQSTPNEMSMAFEYAGEEWPWHYRVVMSAALLRRVLTLRVCVQNLSSSRMPLGLGLHPYFPKTPQMNIAAAVRQQLELSGQGMPLGRKSVPTDLNLEAGVLLEDKVLDHVFIGWDRKVRLNWPEYQSSLDMVASQGSRGLVIWAPENESFVCVEPVSNYPNGFNDDAGSEAEYDVLAAGGEYHASWTFTPCADTSRVV